MKFPYLSKAEFVTLLAALTMVGALAVDIMLPALPNIGEAFAVSNPNDRSLVLMVFGLSFGLAQPFFGPISDRFGRRLPILGGMLIYAACSVASVVAPDFTMLLGIRFIQGCAAAAVRVAVSAAVRDRYEGAEMAEVTSLMSAIFLLVPVLMPGLGQLLLLVGTWPLIFYAMSAISLLICAWAWFRLGDTLPPGTRRQLNFSTILQGFGLVFSNRLAFFYGITGMFLLGAVLGMIFTSQQIYVELYGWGVWYPLAMLAMGGSASLSSLVVSQVLGRIGLRRTAHGAMMLLSALTFTGALLALAGALPAWAYLLICCLCGLPLVSGFASTGALSMQPLGAVAATAASVFGLIAQVFGTAFSYVIAQAYDNSTVPTLTGMGIMGLCGLACCLVAENGRLFGRDDARAAAPA
jgi:DHA1 family bicyclomycin/chloramphenicol resistance-like MFS transporter